MPSLSSSIAGMSIGQPVHAIVDPRSDRRLTLALAAGIGLVCLLAGWLPLGVSIVSVFLFAGPHNWLEGRYMMSRMPARWGPLRGYFVSGISGVLLLTSGFALLPWWANGAAWNRELWTTGLATWNTALVAWILLLVELRSRQNPPAIGAGFIRWALRPSAWHGSGRKRGIWR